MVCRFNTADISSLLGQGSRYTLVFFFLDVGREVFFGLSADIKEENMTLSSFSFVHGSSISKIKDN